MTRRPLAPAPDGRASAGDADPVAAGALPILTLALRSEHDVVLARQRARQVAGLVGFDLQEQTRLATAVSEIARNAVQYGGGGHLDLRIEGGAGTRDGDVAGGPVQLLVVVVRDRGPGIRDMDDVLAGTYTSRTGMGLGILGARRLSDRFVLDSAPGRGTSVVMGRVLPRGARRMDAAAVRALVDEVARQSPRSALDEVRQQNQDLIRTLEALRERQQEVERLNEALARSNRELEETNRGVVALYAELDERAGYLARVNELKTRFLSELSHELRTPLNAIRNLVRLFMDGVVGELTGVQRKTASLIGDSAEGLAQLVDDWLDLAKIEAGKVSVHVTACEVEALFGALRGVFRPMQAVHGALGAGSSGGADGGDGGVALVFVPADGLPPLRTDEAKVGQILRNFVSNALKFTERGEVRVWAERGPDDTIRFLVRDSGIGIASEDQDRIFEEFWQADSPTQRRVKGTGLGLPLSRRLARLLGGEVTVESTLGVGSTFVLALPLEPPPPEDAAIARRPGGTVHAHAPAVEATT